MECYCVKLALLLLIVKEGRSSCIEQQRVSHPYINDKKLAHFECANMTFDELKNNMDTMDNFDKSITVQNVDISSSMVNPFRNQFGRIEILTISQCNITLQDTLTRFEYLYELHLYHSNIKELNVDHIGNSRQKFRKLSLINNNIVKIKNMCNASTTLQKLIIQNNTVKVFDTNFFEKCFNLKTLDLSHNELQTIEPLWFIDMKNNLSTLYLQANKLSKIAVGTFQHLLNLKSLYLNNSNIQFIESGAFFGTSALDFLDLSENRITVLRPDIMFNGITYLNELKLDGNPIQELEPNDFHDLKYLRRLNIGSSAVNKLRTNTFSGLSKLIYLFLPNMNLTNMQSGAFNGLKVLQTLDLADNKIETLICEISENEIISLTYMNFANNNINSINVCAFIKFPYLKRLSLQHNRLSHILVGVLSPLIRLQYLDMSDNTLGFLNEDVLYPLVSLEELDVSGNKLVTFDPQSLVPHMTNLRFVGFSNNQWLCQNLTSTLKYLKNHNVDYTPRASPKYDVQNVNGIACNNGTSIIVTNQSIETSTKDSQDKRNAASTTETKMFDKIDQSIVNHLVNIEKLLSGKNITLASNIEVASQNENNKVFYLILVIITAFVCIKVAIYFKKYAYARFMKEKKSRAVNNDANIELWHPDDIQTN